MVRCFTPAQVTQSAVMRYGIRQCLKAALNAIGQFSWLSRLNPAALKKHVRKKNANMPPRMKAILPTYKAPKKQQRNC